MVDSIDAAGLERLRGAVATARSRVWKLGARPEQIVLDVDATLTRAYSDKELAKGNFKGGYGHHPLLCYLDGSGEGLAGILRAGDAGSNTAADHTAVLELALEQLDRQALDGEILVRADGAGASHELTQFCRDGAMGFSVGFDLDQRVGDAICQLPKTAAAFRTHAHPPVLVHCSAASASPMSSPTDAPPPATLTERDEAIDCAARSERAAATSSRAASLRARSGSAAGRTTAVGRRSRPPVRAPPRSSPPRRACQPCWSSRWPRQEGPQGE